MKQSRAIFRILPLLLLPFAVQGQWTSAYSHVNLAGDFNGWDTLSTNMVLIDHGVWQAYASFSSANSINFKFATADFADSDSIWGEDNQADFSTPMAGIAENPGNDIVANDTLGRTYRFTIDEVSDAYRVDDVTPVFSPWVNEVDYDNVGTDTTEWIEIAGPAGLSLDAYELLFINQGGTVYRTNDLALASFTFVDEADGIGFFVIGRIRDGFGTADYTPADWVSNAIQNGALDSIQLRLKSTQANVHLIDYEGDNPFTAQDQLAPEDDAGDENNRSIFLSGGPGYQFSDFTWTNTVNRETPGTQNTGQLFTEYASTVLISGVSTVPATPGSDTPMHVEAKLVLAQDASNPIATLFYRIDGIGTFLPQAMAPFSGDTWRTASPLPGLPTGTTVEYYLQVTFDGVGRQSPVFAPAGAPATPFGYAIPRLPIGSVWMNELNYRAGFFTLEATNEFIELAGPAGSDISGWQIQLFDSSINYATYTLPEATLLPNNVADHGFFLLGDAGVPTVDLELTQEVVSATSRNLSEIGAIRLVNELGYVEYEYAYSGPQTNQYPDAEYIGNDDNATFADQSLGLSGTGSNYVEFAWIVNTDPSPGSLNLGQVLVGGGTVDPPSVVVRAIHVSGTQVEIVSTGTTTWPLAVEYATHLPDGDLGWATIETVHNTYDDGTITTGFVLPVPGATLMHFRVRQSQP